MQNHTRIGIVGCGGVAAQHLTAWHKSGAIVTALCDLQLEAAKRLSERCAAATVYPDYSSLLDSATVDAISICTPPFIHEEIAVAALNRGIHVLCEKPLAHTIEAAQKIAKAQQRSQALLMPAFRHRFLPGIRKVKEWIEAGKIGQLVYFSNTFCGPSFSIKDRWFSDQALAGGGCMIDTSSHSVDLFRFLCGEIVEQHAQTHTALEGIKVEDSSILTVKSATGVLGVMQAAWVAGVGVAELQVMGQKGRILYDYRNINEVRIQTADNPEWQTSPVAYAGGFTEEIAHFLHVVQDGKALECTLTDGMRALEVIHNAYSSKQ